MQVVLQGSLDRFPLSQVLLLLGGNGHSGTLDLESGGQRTRVCFENGTIIAPDRDAVLNALERSGGSFTLHDEIQIPEGVARVSLDVKSLLEDAAARAAAGYDDETMLRVVDDAQQEEITLSPEELRLLLRIGGGKTFGSLAKEPGAKRELLTARVKKFESEGLITAERPARRAAGPKTTRNFIGALLTDTGDVHPLVDAEYMIGRDAANHIPIPDASISSRHARVAKESDGFVLEDLNSRNGTFVNGEKVTGRRTLANGDMIRFGKVILTFQLADSPKSQES